MDLAAFIARPRIAIDPYWLGIGSHYLCSSATPPGADCTVCADISLPRLPSETTEIMKIAVTQRLSRNCREPTAISELTQIVVEG